MKKFKYTTVGFLKNGNKKQQGTNDKQLAIGRLMNYQKGYVTLNLEVGKPLIFNRKNMR